MTRSTSANTLLTSNGKMNKGCESQVKSVKGLFYIKSLYLKKR